MKGVLATFTVVALSVLTGCNGTAGERELLTVDFQKSHTLRYKFVSSRNIDVDLDPTKSRAGGGSNEAGKSSESVEMVVSYAPVEVDPYGLTTIRARCESVKARRSSHGSRRKDAVEGFAGRTFTFTVGPAGGIEDYSQLAELIKEVGQRAFRPTHRAGRVKEPDMIGDFIASQWFLWDSLSSIKKPLEGIRVGQSWKSKLSVPAPMVMRKARDVTYTLDEIRRSEKGRLAVIDSSYSLAESVPRTWPIPYSGKFRMSGRFGLFRGYKVLDLLGQGEELFNIDAGRIEQYNQHYRMQLEASLPFNIGVNPRITIEQTLSMQLLED